MTTRKTPPAMPGTASAAGTAREAQAASALVPPPAPTGKQPQGISGGGGGGVGGEAPAVRAIVGTAAARGFLTSKRKRSQTAAVRAPASGASGRAPTARHQQQPPPSSLRGASTGVPVSIQAQKKSESGTPASAAPGLGTLTGAATGSGPARASGGVAEQGVPARAAAGQEPAVPSSSRPVNGVPPAAGGVDGGGGGGGGLNRSGLAAVQQRQVSQHRATPAAMVPSSAAVAAPAAPATSAATYPCGGARTASLALGESSSANAAASAGDSIRLKAVGSRGGAISTGKGGVEPWDEDDKDGGTAYGGGGGQGRAAVGGGGGGEVVDPWVASPSGILSAGDREDIAYEVKEKVVGTGEDTVVLLLRQTEVSAVLAASLARILV